MWGEFHSPNNLNIHSRVFWFQLTKVKQGVSDKVVTGNCMIILQKHTSISAAVEKLLSARLKVLVIFVLD